MKNTAFRSGLGPELQNYLEYKICSGYTEEIFRNTLLRFDRFCFDRGINTVKYTKEDALEWEKTRPNEATTTHYRRVNFVKNIMIFLKRKGYDVYIGRDIKFIPTDFQPHIYTEDEITRYFRAVDQYDPHGGNKKNLIQLPVLFRILYCCGTRINETLGIRKKDVDLKEGIICLHETKNNNTRYIVLSDELKDLLLQYSNKCFYALADEHYIFSGKNGQRLSGDYIYELHRKFLSQAGIPYIGEGHGPRIHDWRHTFAVQSFKRLADQGMDMYVALPVLSTYLGHKTIYATEKYLRLTTSIYPYLEKKWAAKISDVFGKVTRIYEKN